MMIEFICKMFKNDKVLTILAFDLLTLDKTPTLFLAEDIPKDPKSSPTILQRHRTVKTKIEL
jgi:hypothetical protein